MKLSQRNVSIQFSCLIILRLSYQQAGAELCQAHTSLSYYQPAFMQLVYAEAAYHAQLQILSQLELRKNFPRWEWGQVDENRVSSAPFQLGLGLSLAKILTYLTSLFNFCEKVQTIRSQHYCPHYVYKANQVENKQIS